MPAGTLSDSRLLQRYAKGDAGAFDMLYARHKDPLYRYLLRGCNSRDTASELFQDVWHKLIGTRGPYKSSGRFITTLFGLAHHQLTDCYHSRRIEPVLSSAIPVADAPQTEALLSHPQQSQRLMAAICALPLAQREVFLLREEGAFSLEEIATITGNNHACAKRRLSYAVSSLGEVLAMPGAEPSPAEQTLENYLAGASLLSQLYTAHDAQRTPPELDARIATAARSSPHASKLPAKAARRPSQWPRYLVACVILLAGLALAVDLLKDQTIVPANPQGEVSAPIPPTPAATNSEQSAPQKNIHGNTTTDIPKPSDTTEAIAPQRDTPTLQKQSATKPTPEPTPNAPGIPSGNTTSNTQQQPLAKPKATPRESTTQSPSVTEKPETAAPSPTTAPPATAAQKPTPRETPNETPIQPAPAAQSAPTEAASQMPPAADNPAPESSLPTPTAAPKPEPAQAPAPAATSESTIPIEPTQTSPVQTQAPSEPEYRQTQKSWLRYIVFLRDTEQHDRAVTELGMFRKHYPQAPLPPELQGLAAPQKN